MMIHTELQYSAISRIILLMAGLWFYQRSKLVRVQSIIISIIMLSSVVFQFATFITSKCTFDVITKVFSSTLIVIIFAIVYHIFWINLETVKYMLEQPQYVYNKLKDQNELAIMEIHRDKAKRYAMQLTTFYLFCMFLTLVLQILPNILDSRFHRLPILSEYFLDQEKYYYLILLHINMAIYFGAMTSLAVALVGAEYFQYICAMFKIASYRIEQAMTIDVLQNINLEIKNMIYMHLIKAIDIHRKAMKFAEIMMSNFELVLFLLILVEVITLSLNLFQIFRLMSSEANIGEVLMHFGFIFACFLSVFLISFVGQEITDYNNHVFITAYNTQWYEAPLHIQKLILYLLQRGNKVFVLNIYGLFVGSVESFNKLISTSISYFTILYSVMR